MRMFLAVTVLVLGPAVSLDVSANWRWMRGAAIAEFTKSDWEIFIATAEKTLAETGDGEIVEWHNPETGTHGAIRPLETSTMDGQQCRRTAFRSETGKGTKGQSVYMVCRQADGSWTLVPDRPAATSDTAG